MATYDGSFEVIDGKRSRKRTTRAGRLRMAAAERLRALARTPGEFAWRLKGLAGHLAQLAREDCRRTAGALATIAGRLGTLAHDDFSRTAQDLTALARGLAGLMRTGCIRTLHLLATLGRKLGELLRDALRRAADGLVKLAGRLASFIREDIERTAHDFARLARHLASAARRDFEATVHDFRSLAHGLVNLARNDFDRTSADLRHLLMVTAAVAGRLAAKGHRLQMQAGQRSRAMARLLERVAGALKAVAVILARLCAQCLRQLAALPHRVFARLGRIARWALSSVGQAISMFGARVAGAGDALVRQTGDLFHQLAYHGRTVVGLPSRLAHDMRRRGHHRYRECTAYLQRRAEGHRAAALQRAGLRAAERRVRIQRAEREAMLKAAERKARLEMADAEAKRNMAAREAKLKIVAQKEEMARTQNRAAEQARRTSESQALSSSAAEPANRPRRVLILVENLPSPFDRRVWQEANALKDAGYLVSIICPTGKGYEKKFEDIGGIHIWRYDLPFEANGALGYLAEYATALMRTFILSWRVFLGRGFDVIHACNPPDLLFLIGGFYKLLGAKFLFDHHDINPELYEAKFGRRDLFYRALLAFERWSFRTADVSIATNESYRQIAIERGGMPAERVFVVRSGPSLERMKIVPPDERLKCGRRHLVGYVGVMGRQEGIDCLLRAVRLIVCRYGRNDIHFGLVGGGTSLEEMKALAVRLDVADYVTFTGRVPDAELLAMLNTAEVCVNPDVASEMNDKSTMNKIMEYMALGKPIVQFDLTEGRYSARGAALNARRGDISDFAARILELIDNPELRSRMGATGRERVLNVLSWDHEVPKLLAAYECLWGGTERGPLAEAGAAP